MLGDMGAERLLEIAEGDELAGQEETFRNWTKTIFAVCVGSNFETHGLLLLQNWREMK